MAFTSVAEYDAAEAAGLCDCSVPLDEHPKLAPPKPWDVGRPCAKTSLERGRGWDARPTPEHSDAVKARWGVGIQITRPAAPALALPVLTARQRQVEAALAAHGGNVKATAAALGMTIQGVYAHRTAIRAAHGDRRPPRPRGIHLTERRMEMLRIVHKHGGNRKAAARELGVNAATVSAAMRALKAIGVPHVPPGAAIGRPRPKGTR